MLQHIPRHPKNRYEMLRQIPKGGVGAEVGVCTGDYAHAILRHAKPSTLYLVDVWPDRTIVNGATRIDGLEAKQIVETRFAEEIQQGVVKLIRCNSLATDRFIASGSLDWVYLDTTHQYPRTLYELRALACLLKPGGLLLGHDYDKVTAQGYLSVKRSVEEFLQESNYFMVILTLDEPASFGLTCCQHALS